jgi:hypothetical protein
LKVDVERIALCFLKVSQFREIINLRIDTEAVEKWNNWCIEVMEKVSSASKEEEKSRRMI